MPETPVFEVDDLIVILLGSPTRPGFQRGRLDGVTRLEKLVYLLEEETRVGEVLTESADYVPYNYGPFSKKVYEAVNMLEAAGLVKTTTTGGSDDSVEARSFFGGTDGPYAERRFVLTDRGREYYDVTSKELPDWVVPTVSEYKETFGSLPLRQLLRYVYENHPDMTTKSMIRDEVLDR